ncbi:MAG: hypothetical protein IJ418_03855 [Clostridia bacterium]|nr:hypothetical protein [Clostridia bacterium]
MKKCSLLLALLLCFFCIHPAQAITIKSAGLNLEYENQNVTRFLNEHPEISLVTTNWDYFTTLELTTRLTTGTMNGDFYILQGDMIDPETLMSKGFCLDLSSSEMLTDHLTEMYPHIAEQLTYNGCLYAWPTDITFSYLRIDPTVWEKAGLSYEKIPGTFSQFLDFLEQWCNHLENDDTSSFHIMGGMDGYDEMFNNGNDGIYVDWLLTLLIEECITQQQLAGEETIQFDEENIKALIKRCVSVGRRAYQVESQYCTEDEGLFIVVSGSMEWPSRSDLVVQLRLNESQPKVIKASLGMLLINPDTENPELCIELLECYADNPWGILPYDQYFYRNAKPRTKPGWEEDIVRVKAEIESIQQKLNDDTLVGTSRISLEDKLADFQSELQWLEKNKWVLLSEVLEDYHENTGMIFFPTPMALTDQDGNSQIAKLRMQVSRGTISVDQFIRKLCEIATMIQQE